MVWFAGRRLIELALEQQGASLDTGDTDGKDTFLRRCGVCGVGCGRPVTFATFATFVTVVTVVHCEFHIFPCH